MSVAKGPLRVCHVVGKMRAGGVESFLMNYYRHIDRDSVQFDFVIDSDSPNHELIPEIESLGGNVYEVPRYQDLPRYLHALENLFRKHSWPIVHSQINALSVFPLMAAKRAGIPVRIAHSHTKLSEGEPLRNSAKLFLRQFANVYPTHRAACGIDAGKWLFGQNANFKVIYNAIELDRFGYNEGVRQEVRDELGVGETEFVFGHIGRFMKQKNHSFLIEAFAEIAKYAPAARLVLAGVGPLYDGIQKKVADLGISSQVMFLGQRSDPHRLYQAFDVFLLPSFYEGFPVVAIEAQASGLPCLIADGVTREAGLLCSTKFMSLEAGPHVWAANAIDLVSSATRKEGQIDAAMNRFDIMAASEDLTHYYESLLP